MIAPRGIDERFIVPRWRSFARTLNRGELSSPVTNGSLDALEQSVRAVVDIDEFSQRPGLYLASDIIDHALHGQTSVTSVADVVAYVLDSPDAWHSLRRSAEELKQSSDGIAPRPNLGQWDPATQARIGIQKIRSRLRHVPRDSISWTDLALAQTVTGDLRGARRAIRTAVSLAPQNRFVVRAAARFFVHVDEPDFALDLLVRGRDGREDPWLLAAEIAVATSIGRATRSTLRSVKHVISDSRFSDRDSSELACALASLEFVAGNTKQGRRLIDRALVDPTENAVAQAEFESQRANFEIPRFALGLPGSDEARTLEFAARGDWGPALEAARGWQVDQTFDADPATYRSYVAAVGSEDFSDAVDAAKRGLISNPGHPTLCNNLAFALASMGETDRARSALAQASSYLDVGDNVARTATRGLIALREGAIEQGRDLYSEAIALALGHDSLPQAGLAAAFYAREVLRISPVQGALVVGEVERLVTGSGNADAVMILDRAREAIGSTSELGRALGPEAHFPWD